MSRNRIILAVGGSIIVIGGVVWCWRLALPPVAAPSPAANSAAIQPEAQRLVKIKAFFLNNRLDPEVSCDRVFPVERLTVETQAVGRAAIGELLRGPTPAEKADGYSTVINDGVGLRSLTISQGIARVEFDEQLEAGVGGSCRVTAIRSQISETLKQFPTVKEVMISINGRTEEILQP